jgi:hypothetical protein
MAGETVCACENPISLCDGRALGHVNAAAIAAAPEDVRWLLQIAKLTQRACEAHAAARDTKDLLPVLEALTEARALLAGGGE